MTLRNKHTTSAPTNHKLFFYLRFNFLLISSTVNKLLPSFMSFKDDISSILLVLGFATESEHILRLSIGNLVDTEPFIRSTNKTGEVLFNIFHIYCITSVNRCIPSSTLYHLFLPFNLEAKGSLMSITITFQSVSPSSKRAMIPSTLTCLI